MIRVSVGIGIVFLDAQLRLVISKIDKLLARTQPTSDEFRRVLVRVLLDDTGRVQAVQLKRSCGDPAIDERALTELQNGRHPVNRLGSKTTRRWHDVAWMPGA
jgi:TonB family protein